MFYLNREAMEWIWVILIMLVVLGIIATLWMEHNMHVAQHREREALDQLQKLTYVLAHAHIETGVCCCGDNMETHDPGYNCGHSPLDMWDHHGEPVLQAAVKFLEERRPEE